MAYQVELTGEAVSNIREIRRYIHADEIRAADRWYVGLREEILSLDRMPYRGRATPEAPHFRQLLFGKRPHIYRIIYSVDDEAKLVTVLHIRHGARDAFDPKELSP